MFRLRHFKITTLRAGGSLARTVLTLVFGVAFAFSTTASAQSRAEPRLKPLLQAAGEKAQPTCTGNNTFRYYFLYANGQVDIGTSTTQNLTQDNFDVCATPTNGDTDLDAQVLHLSCSLDYDTYPLGDATRPIGTPPGPVVAWAVYRTDTNGGVCGDVTFPGFLRIAKETDPDGDPTSFSFSSPSSAVGNFSLKDGEHEDFFVSPGSYAVSETEPGGWQLDNLVCTDPTSNSTTNLGTATATANVASDETVVCTFTNKKTGQIIIRKATVPSSDNSTVFSFTGDAGAFTLTGNGSQKSFSVANGTYDVTESVKTNWDLTNLSCTDPSGGTSTSVATRTASIDVANGETVTCTFTNTQRGRIIVAKQTDPDGSPKLFSFSSDFAGDFQLADGGMKGGGTYLVPGTYHVSETEPAGWKLTGLSCDDNNSVENLAGASASVNVEAGELVTCTFTNTEDGKITVIKQTTPDGSPKVFSFSGPGGSFNLSDGQSHDINLQPGTYQVSETVPYGWMQTSATCDDESDPSSIGLSAGEHVTCTFNNTELSAGIDVLKKTNGEESNSGSCTGVTAGSTVNWSYAVTNTGNVPIAINSISDDNGTPGNNGDDFAPSFVGGDTNGNGLLDTDETWTYSASGTATFQGDGEYNNTVTVNGEASQEVAVKAARTKVDLGDPVSASDASCYITPGIKITKDDGGITVDEGTSFAYTLSYENTGGMPLSDVTITDTVPANTKFNSSNSTSGWSCSNGDGPGTVCTINIGSLAVGASGSVEFGLTVDDVVQPDEETGLCPEEPPEVVVNNTGDIVGTSDAGDVNDEDSDDTPVNTSCDPVLSTLIIAKKTVPGGVTFDFPFTSPDAAIGDFTLTGDGDSKTFGDIDAGTYHVSENTPEGWDLTGATCTNGDDPSSVTLDPGETVTCTFTNAQQNVDLKITKSDGGMLLVPEGGVVVYTLSYENVGNVDLTGVVITETVPVNTTFSAADSTAGWSCADGAAAGTTCTINIGAVAAGGSGQVLFGLTVDELVSPDPETGQCPQNPPDFQVNNTASIVDDGTHGEDSNLSNNQDSDNTPIGVECTPQELTPSIQILKNPPSQLIQLGGRAKFTITVTNNGPVDLINVVVTDPLSPDCNKDIGNLASGGSVSYSCSKRDVRGLFTNVAKACGDVQEGGNVCDDDDADVRVLTEEEPPQSIPIPTLSEWALILMAGLMLLLGGRRVKEWTRR